MYKSPIELSYQDPLWEFTQAINHETEEKIFKCVYSVGINVDKEELLKALDYDRGQYDEGYEDGKLDAVVHAHWVYIKHESPAYSHKCSNCENGQAFNNAFDMYEYCPNCGAKMDEGEG